MSQIRFPRLVFSVLPIKKLQSLSKKYFSIPIELLTYYPNIPEGIIVDDGNTDSAYTRSRAANLVTDKIAAGAL